MVLRMKKEKNKSRQLTKQNRKIKIIEINKPTKEQAQEIIMKISEDINNMFSNNEMEIKL